MADGDTLEVHQEQIGGSYWVERVGSLGMSWLEQEDKSTRGGLSREQSWVIHKHTGWFMRAVISRAIRRFLQWQSRFSAFAIELLPLPLSSGLTRWDEVMTNPMIVLLRTPALCDCTCGGPTHHSITCMIMVMCGKERPLLRPSQRKIFSMRK